jgi:CheY-like chemotaxis protein
VAKILVADDNSNIQKMVGLALKDQGIDVVAVGNGEAAVRKISDIKPDLVLADVFMPVRNGYEVCKYVKDDPKLRHIPVILLVGAFDPLDEQEAQRVGADGVLKKPFVPPDPLISMVKSALARAGVLLGAAAAEKAAEESTRKAADLLAAGASAKLAAMKAEVSPVTPLEPFPEPFNAPPKPFTIEPGQEAVAFGSMLDTVDAEEEVAFASRPNSGMLPERNWGKDSEEQLDVAEEEESGGGWHPGGLEEAIARVTASPLPAPGAPTNGLNEGTDWREEAFHGSSPVSDAPMPSWASGEPQTQSVEAAEVPATAVTTMEPKPSSVPVPGAFSGDAWAAAMSAGVEEKIPEAAVIEADPVVTQVSSMAAEELLKSAVAEVAAAVPFVDEPLAAAPESAEPAKVQESSNGWFSVPPSPWDVEAKKASALAATWDTPVVEAPSVMEHAVIAEPEAVHLVERVEASVEAIVHEDAAVLKEEASSASPYTAEAILDPTAPPQPEVPTQVAMDELVARVIAKLNPEVMQRMTQDILKPVIEALLKDELNAKK